MAWSLQFLGYLRTLSLKFSNTTETLGHTPLLSQILVRPLTYIVFMYLLCVCIWKSVSTWLIDNWRWLEVFLKYIKFFNKITKILQKLVVNIFFRLCSLVDLCLIFEISSLRTWFLNLISNCTFCRLHRQYTVVWIT